VLAPGEVYVGKTDRPITGNELQDAARMGIDAYDENGNVSPLAVAVAVTGLYKTKKGPKRTNEFPESVSLLEGREIGTQRVRVGFSGKSLVYEVNTNNLTGHALG